MASRFVVAAVRSYFEANQIQAVVSLGWKAKARQASAVPSGNRLVFVPGKVSPKPPRFVGGNPRALFDNHRLYQLRIWGYDADNPSSDEHHMQRCTDLQEWAAQALQHAYAGNVEWGDGDWNDKITDLRHGAEIVFALVVVEPIFDRGQGFKAPLFPVPPTTKPDPLP